MTKNSVASGLSTATAWSRRRDRSAATRIPNLGAFWAGKLQAFKHTHTSNDDLLARYADANIAAISNALSGLGPDDGTGSPPQSLRLGLHMVANIASAHVPALCAATRKHDVKPYKNGYDLARYRVGGELKPGAAKSREIVDAALPLPAGRTPRDIYFGAMEVNGTGVQFYGDVCLVLRAVDDQTIILDRNSYDLIRQPVRDEVEVGPKRGWLKRRAAKARSISGLWRDSRDAIAALKVLGATGFRARRLTMGQISDAVRDDEDYVELLRIGSFGTDELSEARLSASDMAREASIDSRRQTTSTPTLASLLWRHRRRIAEQELRKSGVPVRIVTTTGRVKG